MGRCESDEAPPILRKDSTPLFDSDSRRRRRRRRRRAVDTLAGASAPLQSLRTRRGPARSNWPGRLMHREMRRDERARASERAKEGGSEQRERSPGARPDIIRPHKQQATTLPNSATDAIPRSRPGLRRRSAPGQNRGVRPNFALARAGP